MRKSGNRKHIQVSGLHEGLNCEYLEPQRTRRNTAQRSQQNFVFALAIEVESPQPAESFSTSLETTLGEDLKRKARPAEKLFFERKFK